MKPENYTSADAVHTMDGALLNMEQIVHLMEGEDVVGVVRCGQCKFFQSSGCFVGIQGAQVSSDNYCAWGQRKDG